MNPFQQVVSTRAIQDKLNERAKVVIAEFAI